MKLDNLLLKTDLMGTGTHSPALENVNELFYFFDYCIEETFETLF